MEQNSRIVRRFHTISAGWAPSAGNVFKYLRKIENGLTIANIYQKQFNLGTDFKEPSPMWIRESESYVQWNWIAIFSYTASLAVSLAIWRGVFRAVAYFVR
jgi:hypothetical protein